MHYFLNSLNFSHVKWHKAIRWEFFRYIDNEKIKAIFYIICVVFGLMTASCVDDDSFTTSASDVLSFPWIR